MPNPSKFTCFLVSSSFFCYCLSSGPHWLFFAILVWNMVMVSFLLLLPSIQLPKYFTRGHVPHSGHVLSVAQKHSMVPDASLFLFLHTISSYSSVVFHYILSKQDYWKRECDWKVLVFFASQKSTHPLRFTSFAFFCLFP